VGFELSLSFIVYVYPRLRLRAILQADKQAFDWPQQAKANEERERQEYAQVNPKGRLIAQFRPKGDAKDQEPAEKAGEKGRPITGVGEVKIKPAFGTTRGKVEKTGK